MSRFSVAVCGGGVAGMEAVLRLRRLAGDQLDISLVSPSDTLVYRPLTVLEPFGAALVLRYPVARIVSDTGVRWTRAGLDWVDRDERIAHAGGEAIHYDALLLAIGGHQLPAPDGVFVFSDRTAPAYREVLEQTWSGAISRIAFVAPADPGWPLPIYELALLTAAQAAKTDSPRPEIIVGEPGPRPLAAFGREASDAVAGLLANAQISVYSRCEIRDQNGPLLHAPAGDLRPDLIVTVPRITGPNVRGIPGDAMDRFLQVDQHCRVVGAGGRIYAAGDATHLPVKHGGVGAQQADTAAASIVHLAGLGPEPPPLHPVIRGLLLTGGPPLYLTAHLIAGEGVQAEVARTPPWPVDNKIVAEELSVYLAELNATMDADEPTAAPPTTDPDPTSAPPR